MNTESLETSEREAMPAAPRGPAPASARIEPDELRELAKLAERIQWDKLADHLRRAAETIEQLQAALDCP